MVENSMPPYLIHYERNSPWPFTTQQGPPETPTSAFELIEVELEYFAMNYSITQHSLPSDQELQYEACCIIFGSEMLSRDPATPPSSWLRDLLMSSEEITNQARIRPMKSAAKSRFTHLKINGKDSIFEACNVEAQLREYADMPKLLGLDVGDDELQREACNIVRRLARELSWFVAITTSTRNPDSHVPTDEELQHQARWIMFDE
ncbi:hypothetical protein DIS24_g9601 [Lasiodiplodia hormozganensis]|uniref:Uncharacterized protein n=1 Tax=Lasiodiplodia hormozganensis TaxID=869390 RepID=A0AA40CJ14_9PEZI|nr:hypothetical protein DIS24_g9601 [Lasiodiplodia hormozganensis]